MYWDDWNALGIFMADKNHGTGLSTIASLLPGVMDLKASIHCDSFSRCGSKQSQKEIQF